MTPTPRILATLLAATAVALTSACADSGAGPGSAPKLPTLPAGRIVYQISEGGGFIAPDYALATPPAITIYGDGTVYRAVPPGREGPGAPWTFRIGHVSPARLARLVAEADRSGLFDGVDFGMPPISD